MSRAGLEGFGRTLNKEDEVVVEATGNAMAVVRAPEPHVARVIVATRHKSKSSPMRRWADKIDAGVLASLRAANLLPEVWLPEIGSQHPGNLCGQAIKAVAHADWTASQVNLGAGSNLKSRSRLQHRQNALQGPFVGEGIHPQAGPVCQVDLDQPHPLVDRRTNLCRRTRRRRVGLRAPQMPSSQRTSRARSGAS